MRHPSLARPRRLAAATAIAAVAALVTPGTAVAAPAAPATPATVVYTAPNGTGTACSSSQPCAIGAAQQRVRALAPGMAGDIQVRLAGGTYRLTAPLRFGAADSGTGGHTVTWAAAPGAHPVLSGAVPVTGWKLADPASNVWQAPVPAGLDTRQVYVDGREAPIAQTTPAEQGVSFTAATGGYTVSPASWASGLRQRTGAANLSQVEFVYTGGNGPWTQSRCRITGVSGATITMAQPCWDNVIHRPTFRDASGGLPSMSPGTAPTLIENAAPFLHPGQWYLDTQQNVLDYVPAAGQDMAKLDVEVPRLQALMTGAGTLDAPVHDITFSGLTFADATWNGPSSDAGFADVQDNLTLTGADPNQPQGTCTFGIPPGTCPFGALTREPGSVAWHAAHTITFTGDTFTRLGAAGLVFDDGSQHNTIEGNEFAGIAGNAIILGDTTDPHPSDVGADDREISTGNTIADNLIHDIGTDYPSAAAITLFFTQHTTVTHNDLYDLPYTGISAGVIQGHVDNSDHPDNTTNINSDNLISDNLIHHYMQVLHDGGAIYIEGHQGQTITTAGGSVDRAASIAHGLTVTGNVAYDQGNVNFTWYDDAGAQWIGFHDNVEWGGGSRGQGGCEPTGHLDYTGNYNSDPIAQWACSPPATVDTDVSGNTTIPARPSAADLPLATLGSAGLTGPFRRLETARPPVISYTQGPDASRHVLVIGGGFTPGTQVTFGGVPSPQATVLSANAIVATAPPDGNTTQVTVTTAAGSASTAPAIVPAPTRWTSGPGRVTLSPGSRIVIDAAQSRTVTTGPTSKVLGSQTLAGVARDLQQDLASGDGLHLNVVQAAPGQSARPGDISIGLADTPGLGAEGYDLTASGGLASISAATTSGAYWGARTLLQLLHEDPAHRSLPGGSLRDVPALPMRVYMLDMARKYWQPSYIYDLIRQMSYQKMNVLFMHFADAEGFRLNSPQFPGLADPATSYDQAQIESFVAFARAHNVTIIPGFEMPGHATSVTDYFHTGLGDGPSPCPESSVYSWVTPQYVMDLTNPAALTSVQRMLRVFVPWFPGPWVHIGADEIPSSVASCPRVSSYLTAHPELGGLDGLVNTFLNHVDDTLRAMGKQTAVYSGFNPQATVPVHHDVLVTDWTDAASSLAQYPVLDETTRAYLTPNNYHKLYPDAGYLYSQWQPGNDGGVSTQGGAMSTWADYNYWADDSYFENLAALPRAVVADRTWNTTPPAGTLDAFRDQLAAVGTPPGYVGFPAPPRRGTGPIHQWNFEPATRPAGYVTVVPPGNVEFYADSAGHLNGSSYILHSPETVPGVRGQAIHVDGPSQGIGLGGSDLPGPWTLSLWVRRTGSAASGGPSTLLYSQAGREIRLEQQGTASLVGLTTGGNDYHFNYATPLNAWTQLAFVNDGHTTTLYANGRSAGQLNVTMPLPLAALGGPDAFIHGDLDQVTVYDRALNAQEISHDYRAIAPPEITLTPASASAQPGEPVSFTATATNPCSCTLTGAALALSAGPGTGWQVQPATAALGTLGPGATGKAQFTVTAPDSAHGPSTVTATLNYTVGNTAQSATGTAALTLPYATRLLTITPRSAWIAPGSNTTATVTLVNKTGSSLTASWQGGAPAGLSLSPASGTLTAPAHGTADATVTVSAAASAPTATDTAVFTATSASGPVASIALPVRVSPAKPGAGTVWVENFSDSTVTPVSLADGKAGTPVTTGSGPDALAASPDGSTLYAADQNDNTITVIDAATGTVRATWKTGTLPSGMAVSPDGRTLWVADYSDNAVQSFDTATGTASAEIPIGNAPQYVALTPDGKTLLVTDQGDNTVVPLDTATRTAGKPIPAGPGPMDVVVTPDGKTAYVDDAGGTTVTPVDLATDTAETPISLPDGNSPFGLALSPDGTTLYVANSGGSTVDVIDAATGTVEPPLTVGAGPTWVTFSPDGSTAYICMSGNNTLLPVDTTSGQAGTATTVGAYPLAAVTTATP